MKSPEKESQLIAQDENVKEKPIKHWYWDSWVLLSVSAAIIFSVRELCMAEFSHLSFEGLLYMGYGPLPFSIGYFWMRREWKKRNLPEDQAD